MAGFAADSRDPNGISVSTRCARHFSKMRLLKIGCHSRHLVVTVLLLIFVDPPVALDAKSPAKRSVRSIGR
jgi:hypothetical protein